MSAPRKRRAVITTALILCALSLAGCPRYRSSDPLMVRLLSPSPGMARLDALDELEARSDDYKSSIIDELTGALSNEDPYVRQNAAVTFAYLPDQITSAASQELQSATNDADEGVSFHAQVTLGVLGNDAQGVADMLHDQVAELGQHSGAGEFEPDQVNRSNRRSRALQSLAWIVSVQPIEVAHYQESAVAAAADPSWLVRTEAASTLGALIRRDPRCAPHCRAELVKLMASDADERVRRAAADSL